MKRYMYGLFLSHLFLFSSSSVDGELYTWGWGVYGQLGHGDSETLDVPTLVNSLPEHQKVLEVFCGGWNTLITVASHL